VQQIELSESGVEYRRSLYGEVTNNQLKRGGNHAFPKKHRLIGRYITGVLIAVLTGWNNSIDIQINLNNGAGANRI
jgi:hypothetical protein